MKQYSILLPRTSKDPHTHTFDEVAEALQEGFAALGYDAPLVHDVKDVGDSTAIVLASHLLYLHSQELPPHLILYNFEQIYEGCRWFNDYYRYHELLKRYPVWDYSKRNISALKALGINDKAIWCPHGYMPSMSRIPLVDESEKDIDVLFIGTVSKRRQVVLDGIRERGLKVEHIKHLYGKKRDEYIARAKIHLNIHLYPTQIFEQVRVNYLLANQAFVISEDSGDALAKGAYANMLVFATYDQIVERCVEYLSQPQSRDDIAKKGVQLIRSWLQYIYVAKALEQSLLSGGLDSLPTIFVALPSYLDHECVPTIKRMFASAKHAERLVVGVCWQTNSQMGAFPYEEFGAHRDQLRVTEVDVADTKGANWARSQAMQLAQGEDYALMMDAHMYMRDHWDVDLIKNYRELGRDKLVLTYYCPPYDPPNQLAVDSHSNRRVIAKYFGEEGDPQLLHLNREVINASDPRFDRYYPSPFIVHHFIFTRLDTFKQIPIDPNIRFWGDELTLSLRLWTHGYSVYQLPNRPAYHQWNHRDRKVVRNYRDIDNQPTKDNAEYVKSVLGLPNQSKAVVESEYTLGKERAVDGFWQFSGVDLVRRIIHPHGKNGLWDVSALHDGRPSIFVNIASYRDQDCKQTVEDLFAKAKYPQRVSVGVCWQVDEAEDSWFERLDGRGGRVRQLVFDWRESKGVCWARAQAGKLWQGEDYVLQIDSHSRFATGWDEALIEEHQGLGQKRAVISAPPATFKPSEPLEAEPLASVLRLMPFRGDGNLRTTGALLEQRPPQALKGLFISAGFMFAPSAVVSQVLYDPALYFDQEEMAYALRLFTHGVDVYHSVMPVVYHHYAEHAAADKHFHWQDMQGIGKNRQLEEMLVLGLRRFNRLTGHQGAPLQRYNVGLERSLKQFEMLSGIDFKAKTVAAMGLRAGFIEGLEAYVPGELFVPELDEAFGDNKTPQKTTQKTTLAGQNNGAKISLETKSEAGNMAMTATNESILMCLSARDNTSLQKTLSSLLKHAARQDQLRIAIAWMGEQAIELPASLSNQERQLIEVRHVASGQVLGNAFRDAIATWRQEEVVAFANIGAEFVSGWDEQLCAELAALKDGELLTCIASESSGELCYIAAGMADSSCEELLISTQAVPASEEQSTQTPLVSMDLLAGSAATMLKCLPDPYMSGAALELSYAARLWTYGIALYQPTQTLVYGANRNGGQQRMGEQMLVRAQHVLGLAYTEQQTALIDLDRYGHGEQKDVDDFWKAAGVNVDAHTIHPKALKGEWEKLIAGKVKLTTKQMLPISTAKVESASNDYQDARIFVQIASYRDEQCQYTVQDLFANAKNPDRITVGIVWQSIPQEDQECFRIVTRPEQVRVTHFDARESKGACWARHHGQKLWQGEEFTLQIDSHMRFESNWDEMLLNMQEQIGKKKAVLTTYPAGFTPPDKLQPKTAHRLAAKEFNQQGILTMKSLNVDMQTQHKPVPGAFVSGCMLFGPSSIITDVPYDPYLYFFGEEISLSVRLWTHGYDIYHPNKHVMWHDWKRENRKTTHFKDHDWQEMNRKSFARVRFMLAKQNPQRPEVRDYVRQEIDKYGLGNVRGLREFETYAGVSFVNRVISDRAHRGDFSFEEPYGDVHKDSSIIKTNVDVGVPAANTNQVQHNVQPYENTIKPVIMPKQPGLVKPSGQPLASSGPIKTLETAEIVVYDNFLPEDVYESLYNHAVNTDYKHINTTGNVSRVWNLDNGFPLRSSWNRYYRVPGLEKKTENDYPQQKPTDAFIERINQIAPDAQHLIGAPGVHWAHFSVTSWLYPQNTGLSLHNDGSGVYSGAYVYFLNKEWRIHWGGLLMVMDSVANEAMEQHKLEHNPHQFHRAKWLHETEHNDYAMEAGFARTIFPKRNRIVFIAPDAYHIVTKILSSAGDNVRMTHAGFFNRGPLGKEQQGQQQSQQKKHPLEMNK